MLVDLEIATDRGNVISCVSPYWAFRGSHFQRLSPLLGFPCTPPVQVLLRCIISLPYVRSPELIYHAKLKICTLRLTPLRVPFSSPWKLHSTLCSSACSWSSRTVTGEHYKMDIQFTAVSIPIAKNCQEKKIGSLCESNNISEPDILAKPLLFEVKADNE